MDRYIDLITDFLEEVRHMNLKKRAKNLRKQARKLKQNMPEVNLHGSIFDRSDFLMGLAIGGFVGFLVSMLVAPKSGPETRAFISEKSRAVGEKAKDTFEGAVDKTGRLAAEGRDRVGSVLHRGQKQIDATKIQGRDLAYETREQVSDTMHRAADEIDPNRRF